MMQHFSRFIKSGPGLEKTLRLIQAVAQIGAALSVGSLAVQLTTAKLQFSLGRFGLKTNFARAIDLWSRELLTAVMCSARKYFRFFNFIDSFQRVSVLLGKEGIGSVAAWLELAKWTCFGLYFVLEDLTILHAMSVYAVPWNDRVLREANQFWFYALLFSLAGGGWALLSAPTQQHKSASTKNHGGKKKSTKGQKLPAKSAPHHPQVPALVRQMVVDGCDLLIPGSFLGWIPTGDLVVGGTAVVSTVLTGRVIWEVV
ncbi:peroxin-11B Pex11B-Penicillium chrysogenum [Penicillium alfredii]|uniref:Peroxin-11B Pex11B-Penicillium chrysogenum n=1 Tax=Penicillium alfredii TaxID=1506179 RepID=A0A9W9EHG9_9EURO|nr:peroxin-11B Pex11B-Penicillium chrysogenum [Penicillium alfredii]KAJ5081891.1 peroxin-11B Pex11B-Penicillium chrysogenum [Penicillium alfredii]